MIKEKVVLLKLGGSLLTDKNRPFSIREDVMIKAVEEIIDANVKLLLIHGGGSFGHPVAKKYKISEGLNKSVPKQLLGLSKTHHSMVKLNSHLINLFLEKEFPTLSIQTSSIFLKNSGQTLINSIDLIETVLDLDILPILYGDIILSKGGTFSIISGDQIIFELCQNLRKYRISKVIFTMETDGIYVSDEKAKLGRVLLEECTCEELDNLNLADMDQKIDVTKGIRGKINFIKKICNQGVPVQLVNGLLEGYIYKSLKNQEITCTKIIADQ